MENLTNMVAGRPPIYSDHQYALTFRIASFEEQQAYYKKQYGSSTHTKGEPCSFIFKEGKDIIVANYKPRKSIMLPSRMEFGDNPIEIFANYAITKIDLRVEAKNNQLYSLKVDNGGKCGKNEDGSPIEINTLGKWLFGVPYYKGHIQVIDNNDYTTTILLPQDCPKESVQLIKNTINIITTK